MNRSAGFRLDRSVQRICMVLPGVGDVVHGMPVANALKRDAPGRTILWIAEPAPAEVVRNHPAADEIVPFHRSEGVRGLWRLREALRDRSCQLTLNFQFHAKSAFPTLFSGSPVRVGFGTEKAGEGLWLVHTHRLPQGPWRHTQDLYLEFLDFLGVPRGRLEWGITLSQEEERDQRSFFAAFADRPVAGLVLASANPRKDWLPDRYARLADALEFDFGFRVLLLGGPGARERTAADQALAAVRGQPVDTLEDSVRRLVWLIGGCDLVVSPDTGPLHVAHAMSVPVIGLYGHTNPWRVGPYCRYHDLLVDRYTDPGEAPDPSRYEPRRGRMERITVDDVLERVERARNAYGAGLPPRSRSPRPTGASPS